MSVLNRLIISSAAQSWNGQPIGMVDVTELVARFCVFTYLQCVICMHVVVSIKNLQLTTDKSLVHTRCSKKAKIPT